MVFPILATTSGWGIFCMIVIIAIMLVTAIVRSIDGDRINFPLLMVGAAIIIASLLSLSWDRELSVPWNTVTSIASCAVFIVATGFVFVETYRGKGFIADRKSEERKG